jgi:hypothetical protein
MRFQDSNPRAIERRRVRYIAAVLEELIDDCSSKANLNLILRRARGEIVSLLSSREQILSRQESLAG